MAAQNGNALVLKVLVEKFGANVNIRDHVCRYTHNVILSMIEISTPFQRFNSTRWVYTAWEYPLTSGSSSRASTNSGTIVGSIRS